MSCESIDCAHICLYIVIYSVTAVDVEYTAAVWNKIHF